MQKALVVKWLKQCQLFQNIPKEALHHIAERSKFRQFFPEDTIVWQGNPSDSLYIIVNGIVAVKKYVSKNESITLAHLMPGNTFGEVGILENRARSANIEAISDVDLLVIQRKDFMDILFHHPGVAIELARMLGQYLTESNRRSSRKNSNSKMVLIFDTFEGGGATSIGVILAKIMREKSREETVYTEYPNPQSLLIDLNIDRKAKIFHHPEGFDIYISDPNEGSSKIQSTLMIDKLINNYTNIIITIKRGLDDLLNEDTIMMLDYANEILVMVPPLKAVWRDLDETKKQLRKHVSSHETNIFTVVSRSHSNYESLLIEDSHDFDIPYFTDFPSLSTLDSADPHIPTKLREILETFVDRIDRTNQLGIFIPTTVDVNQQIDSTVYVRRTLDFLAERFGGATSKEADGVWNSQEVGLVGEKVYIVHTYLTHAALNQYMDEVIEYVKTLKTELKQEAMAIEINQKLTLI
jgi:CRP-like cAMP-binding protein